MPSYFGSGASPAALSCNVKPPRPYSIDIDNPAPAASTTRQTGLEAPGSSIRPKLLTFHCFETNFDTLFKMLLHSLPRTARTSTTSSRSSSRKLSSSVRCFQSSAYRLAPSFSATHQAPVTSQSQSRSAHAISNPTLAGIEKRWEGMPPQEQAELWMQLRDRMKVDWHEMTLQEKKAGTFQFFVIKITSWT